MPNNRKCNRTKKGIPDTPNYSFVTMANIDQYLHHESIQYVDIRETNELFVQGCIETFEIIPFYTGLVGTNIVAYKDDFVFTPEVIINQRALEKLFDKNKTIFLICRSGRRSGYLKDVLSFIGYNAFNIGGIIEYKKQNTK